MYCIVLVKVFIRPTYGSVQRILTIVIEKGNRLDYTESVLNSDGVRSRIVQFHDDPISVVTGWASMLDL